MTLTTVAQAVKNAIEAEHAAARFYARLARLTEEPKAKKFFLDMVGVEQLHAGEVEAMARMLVDDRSDAVPSSAAQPTELAPEWLSNPILDIDQALKIALQCETQASSYYDTLARLFQGSASAFFRGLADMERVHAQMVQRAIEERRFASSGASSLAQAVGQVIELERSALDFYEKILQRVTDPGAKKFFADMVALEQSHDVAIEKLKSSLQAGSIALRAKELIGSLETAPCWFYSEDEDLEKLLKMAVDFENAASRFYLAVAEHLDGEEATILRELGLAEEEHGRILWDALRHRIPPLV